MAIKFECPECGKKYKYQRWYNKHMAGKHLDSLEGCFALLSLNEPPLSVILNAMKKNSDSSNSRKNFVWLELT